MGPTPLANGTATLAYGSDWRPADINADTARQADTEGHGTHVVGIATGDGSATGGAVPAFTYVGMAPKAPIAVVKTNFSTTGVLDGVNYVFQRASALGLDAVVNLSLGSQYGPHDGTSAFEAGLSAMTGPGRIVIVSAGNDREVALHAEVFAAGAGTNTTLSVTGSLSGMQIGIDGYYESTENVNVRIQTPLGTVVGPVSLGVAGQQVTTAGTVYVENGFFLTATGDREVYIVVTVGAGQNANGTWTFTFIPVTLGPANGEVDLWRFFLNAGTANFVLGNQGGEEKISEPGNAVGAITVAAHVTKNSWVDCGGRSVSYSPLPSLGSLAASSSPGPTRDGREKPDISAPGMGIGSATTFDIAQTCPAVNNSTLLNDNRQHRILQGTSMAAPHVTGAAVMYLAAFPGSTPAQVNAYLASTAVADASTGVVWNKDWGYGKLFLPDGDMDGAGDLGDSCKTTANPRVPAEQVQAWMTLTGGQRDDDGDGYGNECDPDYTNGRECGSVAGLLFTNYGHYAWMNREMYVSSSPTSSAADMDCGRAGLLRCSIFDKNSDGIVDISDYCTNNCSVAVWAVGNPEVPIHSQFQPPPTNWPNCLQTRSGRSACVNQTPGETVDGLCELSCAGPCCGPTPAAGCRLPPDSPSFPNCPPPWTDPPSGCPAP